MSGHKQGIDPATVKDALARIYACEPAGEVPEFPKFRHAPTKNIDVNDILIQADLFSLVDEMNRDIETLAPDILNLAITGLVLGLSNPPNEKMVNLARADLQILGLEAVEIQSIEKEIANRNICRE